MKTELTNPDNKLSIDDQITDWLTHNESELDGPTYRAAILGADGKTEYRTISVGGLGQVVKLTDAMWKLGLVDLLKESGPVKGFDSVFALKERARDLGI